MLFDEEGHITAILFYCLICSEIIILIRQNPQITQAELVEQLNTSLRTVKRITKRLSEKGIMVRKGGKRFGYWEVL